ncbi:MAG TPA: hypothetical protein VFO24_05000, partial [Usitatibacter sp.]|nr:hypothetical protein [Usitatibacter sp.]
MPLALAVALVVSVTVASSALAGPVVTVRVEGESATLLPLTAVTLEAPEPASGCPANSATAAINLAVKGNWDHGEAEGSKGDFTETILGETHNFTHESDTWAIWIDDKWGGGICEDLLSEGDEVLVVADHEPPPYAPTRLPLVLAGTPATAVVGVPFTIHVNRITTRAGTFAEIGEGTPVAEAGATVSGGGLSAVSDAGGLATITPQQAGVYTLIATKAGDAPSAPVTICVRAEGESGCGVQVPPPSPGSTPVATLTPPYVGPFALVAHVADVAEGRVYPLARAPRLISGTVSSHSAVSSVGLELRRRYKGRCSAFDGVRAEFRRARCGTG